MNMNLRYEGGFYSLDKTLYEVKIYQEGFQGEKTQVAFTSDPLVIEWPETDKLEPVQSSNATLQLYSDSDRQFLDLYTAKVGSVRMDVWRGTQLYWSGTMDPELYEEPFAYKSDYGVKITFADFAILDRLKFGESGFHTLAELLQLVLYSSGIKYDSIVEYIGTQINPEGVSNGLLADISLLSDNFYDEDGTPMTLREVLDETLRPFALRLIQKEGKIFIYDLNTIYKTLKPENIMWDSDDSSLSYDKLYNNVKLSFSPYHHTRMLDAKVDRNSVKDGISWTVKVNDTENIEGFKITLSDTGKGIVKASNVKYFKIDPVFSGNEDSGVAWTVKNPKLSGANYQSRINEATPDVGEMLMKTEKPVFVASTYSNSGYMLRVSLDVLADVRYNPYESQNMQIGDDHYPNEQGDFNKRLVHWCNFSYIPIRLILRDTNGVALYHYENKQVASETGGYNKWGSWVSGEGAWGDAFLAYYDLSDRKSNTGLGGWKTNKQCIGYYRDGLPSMFEKRGDGEFILLPIKSGWLDFQVGSGLPTYDYKSKHTWQTQRDIYWRMRWLLYRNMRISLVDLNYQDIKADDIEINAWLNLDAKEELKIDTIIGCLDKPSPTALGQVFATWDKSVRNSFSRNGRIANLEKLLIGTAYANYASKHIILSGTACILPTFGTYGDTSEEGIFLLLSESQSLMNDTSEIKMVQFEEDYFKGIEYNG